MYKPIHAKNGDLKHSTECKMAFGRKDLECPRCQEILNGGTTRDGWQKVYYAKKQDPYFGQSYSVVSKILDEKLARDPHSDYPLGDY